MSSELWIAGAVFVVTYALISLRRLPWIEVTTWQASLFGAVLMLVIDGRQMHSIGASFGDVRDVMIDFGAVNACNLDGGSSTVMYFNGEYINSPSSASGTSRALPNAFLVK